MSHVNARLTFHGRRLIVDRVAAGRPVAHIAAELGVSRQTAYRTSAEQAVLDARRASRFGPLRIGALTGVPAWTVGRILHRQGIPHLADCDPVTGTPIRAARITANRY